ncbi:MAG: 3'-5' exonuclease [Bacilli bacterium]|nr:3'-5' exonuclease [Bacilli bacterium]
MKCLICNKENNNKVCNDCINKLSINEIIERIRSIENLEYEEYREIINNVANTYQTPLKEYCMIMSNVRKYYRIPKINQEYLLENAFVCLESDLISNKDKNVINTLLLDTYYKNYLFDNAESIAENLKGEMLDELSLYALGDYYTITRRYDIAENYLENAIMICHDESTMKYITDKLIECQERRKGRLNGGRAEYMPSSQENKEKYIEFMKTINIEIEKTVSRAKVPDKISNDDYPLPVELKESGFKSFIAFDLETTGIDHSKDSITEIAAIRVVNGEIVESKEFIFQELVHPYKKRIPENVEKITGITNEMVHKCREVWEVFKDFSEFIGDDILVGYNCMSFDSKFLRRAGRLSNKIITNKYFDVMNYIKKFESVLHYENKTLSCISGLLGITNPNAHRALADSVTTAKVYLKLLELEETNKK